MATITSIRFHSPLEDENPDNGNADVAVRLSDGREYALTVATPNNVTWIMDNEEMDYFLLVRKLTRENVEKAVHALVTEDDGKWLEFYGVLASSSAN